MNSLYITKMHSEIIIAYRSEGKLTEIMVENEGNESIVGNIYKARVISVSSGLKAAFIDYGERKKGFLPLTSADGKVKFSLEGYTDEEVFAERTIREKDEILVQIEREEISVKGARLTSYITIPGNFMVLVPDVSFLGISKKIRDRKRRNEMRQYMKSIIAKDMGVIMRTAAIDAQKSQLKKEYRDLVNMWNRVKKNTGSLEAPALVYKESSFVIKTIRNIIKKGLDEIITDNKTIYNDIMRYFSFVNAGMKKKLQLYQFEAPLMSHYDLDREMDTMFNINVHLKHGAYIVIEPTEALTAIDVNSGRMSRSKDQRNLITDINLMAAEEIARQLRLRDIGGLIVVDFIDMNDEASKRRVVSEFKRHLRNDRSTTRVLKVSKFGLVEMTRKRVRPTALDHFVETCSYCQGRGYTPKPVYVALKFIRWIKDHAKAYAGDTLIVTARDDIIEEINAGLTPYLRTIMKDWKLNIKIEENSNIDKGFLEIYSYKKLEKIATIT